MATGAFTRQRSRQLEAERIDPERVAAVFHWRLRGWVLNPTLLI